MSSFVRRSASLMVSATSRMLPLHLSTWADAMRRELAEAPSDAAALVFAMSCLRAVFTLAITTRLRSMSAATRSVLLLPTILNRSSIMNGISARPRLLGLICGAGAVTLGIAYMFAAGAPSRYLFTNLAALVIGAMVWAMLGGVARSRLAGAGAAVLVLAVTLFLTALFGAAADGASRWVSVGPVNLQVGLAVLPAMIVLYTRRPDAVGTAGMVIAALALALQPDRAMAGVLLAGLLGLLLAKPNRAALTATAAAGLACGWTLLTPDTLLAVPYVDRILYTAFDIHPLAGLAVVLGAGALVMPALIGLLKGTGERAVLLAFAGCWAGMVIAAALGNYPTPLVGYGASAVLGYLLSVALLPNVAHEIGRNASSTTRLAEEKDLDRMTSDLHVARLF